MKKIILAGTDDLFLVTKELAKTKAFDLVSITAPLTKACRDTEVPVVDFGTLVTDDIRKKAMADLIATYYGFLDEVHQKTSSLSPHKKNQFDNIAAVYVYQNAPELAIIAQTLNEIKPDGAIVLNDVEPLTRTIALWCVANNKPCVHLPHAVYLDYERGRPGTDVHDLVTASHLAAAGTYQAQWYATRGMKNISITGIPRFDRLYKLPFNREMACTLLGLDHTKPVVSYYSSWRQDTNLLGCNNGIEETYTRFLTIAAKIPGVQYIVKTHPRGGPANRDWHAQQVQKANLRCVVTDAHLDVILSASNVCISYGPSNVLLEAAILGKSLISLGGFSGEPDIMTVNPESERDIESAIVTSLQLRQAVSQAFLQRYVGFHDSNSTKRVTDYIVSTFQ